MSSIAVQTEETVTENNFNASLSIGLFTQILSILDDEHNDFYYDISDYCSSLPSKADEWHVDNATMSGNFELSTFSLEDDESSISVNNDKIEEMSTAELERSLQISEARLKNNLNELNKISSSSTEHVKEWLDSTCSQSNNSTLNSPREEAIDKSANAFSDFEVDGI
ncbi:unnamed protein product [Trichobilharzia szidati]|nr:unnamed protein product [Trichobilharzia szidati]